MLKVHTLGASLLYVTIIYTYSLSIILLFFINTSLSLSLVIHSSLIIKNYKSIALEISSFMAHPNFSTMCILGYVCFVEPAWMLVQGVAT